MIRTRRTRASVGNPRERSLMDDRLFPKLGVNGQYLVLSDRPFFTHRTDFGKRNHMADFLPDKSFFDFNLTVLDSEETMRRYGDFAENAETLIFLDAEQNTPELRELLANILKAALNDAHERTIVLHPHPTDAPDLRKLREQYGLQTVLFFGYPPARIGWSVALEPYRWTTLNGCRYLLADALPAIATDTKRKRALWGALQTLKTDT